MKKETERLMQLNHWVMWVAWELIHIKYAQPKLRYKWEVQYKIETKHGPANSWS